MFLAMDTVFDQCSIAILDGTGKVIACQTETGKRMQTQQILPMIDAALSTCQLSLADMKALIFNRGPGAFSGIRINTAVVQALSEVYSALDARMQQVYFGHYALNDNLMQAVDIEGSDNTERLQDYDCQTLLNIPLVGNGAAFLAKYDTQVGYEDVNPDAAIIGQLGVAQFMLSGGTDAAQALPKYLRNQAWKTLKEQGKA